MLDGNNPRHNKVNCAEDLPLCCLIFRDSPISLTYTQTQTDSDMQVLTWQNKTLIIHKTTNPHRPFFFAPCFLFFSPLCFTDQYLSRCNAVAEATMRQYKCTWAPLCPPERMKGEKARDGNHSSNKKRQNSQISTSCCILRTTHRPLETDGF